MALNEREDLNEAKKNFDVASLAYSAAFSGWLPRADVEATYGTLPKRDQILPDTPAWGALVKVTLPLFSGFETHYERTAKAREMERADTRVTRLDLEIKTQVENALAKVEAIEARLDLEEKNIERAKRYYEITTSEYKRGVKNSPDLSGAAERLFDSRLRTLQLRRDFYLGSLAVAEAVGVDRVTLGQEH